MAKGMLSLVRVVLNWLLWFIAKLLLIKGNVVTGLTLEAASRMLGCAYLTIRKVRMETGQ